MTLTQTRASAPCVGVALPGEHVHSWVGKCEPPFTSAGPHFNPESKKHGKLNKEGHHAGDLDNIRVPANGNLTLPSWTRTLRSKRQTQFRLPG